MYGNDLGVCEDLSEFRIMIDRVRLSTGVVDTVLLQNSPGLSVWGSISNLVLNTFPGDIVKTLHDDTDEKIREYHVDYNNRPTNSIAFMTSYKL